MGFLMKYKTPLDFYNYIQSRYDFHVGEVYITDEDTLDNIVFSEGVERFNVDTIEQARVLYQQGADEFVRKNRVKIMAEHKRKMYGKK